MNGTIVQCARAICGERETAGFAFAVQDGLIAAVGDAGELCAQFPGAELRTHGAGTAVVPGFINGHSHAYQILLRGWADDLPFARWRADALYKVVPQLSPEDIYWTFRLAFDEMLAAGITTVAEFFYLNGSGNDHAREALRAASDAGIRIVFARTWMDAAYAPDAFRETIDSAAERTRRLMEEFPWANVCVAPHSLHAASPEMIGAAAQFSTAAGCMLHVHVAEGAYEGQETVERLGATPIRVLDDLGALNARTVAIHAIYVSEEEKDLIAQRGARVVHNPMTNQYLGDGICDVAGLQRRRVQMGLGTDADVSPSPFDEMRAASLLQKVSLLDGSALGARTAFDLATAQGARALSIGAGALQPGFAADYVVLDTGAMDPWIPLHNQIVYRAHAGHVLETYVGGRKVRERGDAQPDGARRALAGLMPKLTM